MALSRWQIGSRNMYTNSIPSAQHHHQTEQHCDTDGIPTYILLVMQRCPSRQIAGEKVYHHRYTLANVFMCEKKNVLLL